MAPDLHQGSGPSVLGDTTGLKWLKTGAAPTVPVEAAGEDSIDIRDCPGAPQPMLHDLLGRAEQ